MNGVEEVKHFTGPEEHIVYTHEGEGNGEYLTHTTPTDGTVKGLATDMMEVLAEYNSLESLVL